MTAKCFFLICNDIDFQITFNIRWAFDHFVKSEKSSTWAFIQKRYLHLHAAKQKEKIEYLNTIRNEEWRKIKSLTPTTNDVFADMCDYMRPVLVTSTESWQLNGKSKKSHPFGLVSFVKCFGQHGALACVYSACCVRAIVAHSEWLIGAFCSHLAHLYENNEWVIASE